MDPTITWDEEKRRGLAANYVKVQSSNPLTHIARDKIYLLQKRGRERDVR